jgi:hypothetical protein
MEPAKIFLGATEITSSLELRDQRDALLDENARLRKALERFDTGCRVFDPKPDCGCVGCTARAALEAR